MTISSLLLLADGRFPDGAHAHSHGLEHAVEIGRVHDVGSLTSYVTCRLWAAGRTDAATAHLAAAGADPGLLDAAWCVRTPSEVARATARALGRSLARTASRIVPDSPVALADGGPPVQPVALGLVAAAIGCDPHEAALASAHGTVATACAAGLRLLALDPFDVAAVLHDLRADVEAVALSASGVCDIADLPHASTPFAEIDVQRQHRLPSRLFQS